MSGTVATEGAQAVLNHIAGNAPVYIGSSSPTWIPGLTWVNDSTNPPVAYKWNGSSWVSGVSGGRYLMLLTEAPGDATTISGLTEVTTSGYSRQLVQWTDAADVYPSDLTNTNLVTFGPLSADMLLPAQWLAMVDVASGTAGNFLYSWTITSQQVDASQNIQISIGQLSLSQS